MNDTVDMPRLKRTWIVGFDFTPTNKVMRLQTRGVGVQGDYRIDSTLSPHFGEWCLIAPPLAPTTDGTGNISDTAESMSIEIGDDNIPVGTRDVRISKYGQDVKGGEVVLTNSDGFRIKLGHDSVGLIAGGGFLNFDIKKKTVGLGGIPSSPGAGVPYLAIDSSSIGIVSATGAASVAVKGSGVTASGSSCALDFGGITLGKAAADAVVLQSLLAAALNVFLTQLNAHVHGAAGTPPTAPMTIPMLFSSQRVKCA